MPPTIVPGYDFGLTEVPTKNKFIQAASGLQITGVDFADILLSDVTAILLGSTSGTTGASLPSQGFLWSGPGGEVWVEAASGPVQLNRVNGGWESIRYYTVTDLGGSFFPRGVGMQIQNASVSEPTALFRTLQLAVTNGSANWLGGICPNTAPSGVRRYVARGAVEMLIDASLGTDEWQPLLIHNASYPIVSTPGGQWVIDSVDAGNPIFQPTVGLSLFSAVALGPDSGSSTYTNAEPKGQVDAYGFAYFWGPSLVRRQRV